MSDHSRREVNFIFLFLVSIGGFLWIVSCSDDSVRKMKDPSTRYSAIDYVQNFDQHLLRVHNDTLEVLYFGEGETVEFVMEQGLTTFLKKVDTDTFFARVYLPGVSHSVFSYDIRPYHLNDEGRYIPLNHVNNDGLSQSFIWRNPKVHPAFSPSTNMKGIIDTIEYGSEVITGGRRVYIFTPEGWDEKDPIIYMTDGQGIIGYASRLDSLITSGRNIPVKLVGVASSDDQRYFEYVSNRDRDIFKRHERFFIDRVISDVEADGFNGDRWLYGVSDGAAFGMYMAINHASLFTGVIAFSTVDYISEIMVPIRLSKRKSYPEFIMGAGQFEESVIDDNRRFVQKMREYNMVVDFTEWVAGHDYYTWEQAFMEVVCEKFQAKETDF